MFLQSMREKTQSWVAYVIVGLLILSFALWGISSYFSGGKENTPVATVGGKDITYANFISTYHHFIQDAQTREGSAYTPKQQQYARQLVLKSLIERLAIAQYITKLGFAVDQQQIDSALMSVPLFSDHNEFSPALFKRFLVANSVSAQQFIADFSTRMTVAQWEEGIRITSFSTPLEITNLISLLKQQRTILYSIVKASQKGLKPISSSQSEEYYHEHQQNFVAPERVKIAYVALHFSDLVKGIHPSNDALIKYYTQESSRYDIPESWQVDVIRIQSSSSADEVALQVSTALSKDKTLSSFPQAQFEQRSARLSAGNLNQEIKNALSRTNINATTPAFKTGENTYIVYKLLKHQSAVNKQYYEVKSQVRAAYIDQEASKQWNSLTEDMTNLSYEHPDSLDLIAEKLKVNIQTSDLFSHDYDGKQGVESNAEVITAAFSDDVLAGGNNSDVIKLDRGKTAIVLRVSDHIAAHEQPFSEVQGKIKKVLQNQQAVQAAKEKAALIKQALASGQPIDKIQQQYGVVLSKISVGRFDQSLPGEVLQQSFMLPVSHVDITHVGNFDFAVVQVLSVTPGKISSVSAKERAIYQNVVINEWAQAELLSYVKAIVQSSKVDINKQALVENA